MAIKNLTFSIDGEPIPRHEIVRNRGLIDARKKEKSVIKFYLRAQYPGPLLAQAVRVELLFHLAIPQSTTKAKKLRMLTGKVYPTKKPDCSNLQKLYEDCLTGTVLEDDRFVVKISSEKFWAYKGFTIIKVSTLEESND